ncbi:MAG: NADPH-adrenodoxin reductase [Pleopsidium flavum]|nr:MAG: NADPH-adrenodoxin reductase [Pleopsidium flavum]
MAVIGSGPAGFYTAYKVMSKIEHAVVDMYEHLPVPYGLVRFGVAPDHPEVKNCQDKFAEVGSSSRFNFIGNIDIGKDLPLSSLEPHYDAILFAYGASKDKRLRIPGENDLKGIYSARAFVGWYNGLPEYADLAPMVDAGEEAVVIGQGNVALDVARTLLTDIDVLKKTDMTDYALEALSKSRVKRVRVVGRRGPMQKFKAAFTIKEVRELLTLPSVSFDPIPPTLLPPNPSTLPRAAKRLTQLLSKGSPTPPSSSTKSWSLEFLLSPTSFNPSPTSPTNLSSITLEKTTLQSPNPFDSSAKVTGTGERTTFPASLAFRSIGYQSTPIPGMSALGIPFDQKLGIIPNDLYGRIITPSAGPGEHTAAHIPGMYCAGWVKRGPTGVIASTMNDAFATAEGIAQDWEGRAMFLNGTGGGGARDGETRLGWEGVRKEAEQRGLRRVSWGDWERIDASERERGRRRGKEREKFASVREMLGVLD